MGSLVAAYTIAWAILMFYVFTLARRQRHLRHQMDQLQATSAESGTSASVNTKAGADAN